MDAFSGLIYKSKLLNLGMFLKTFILRWFFNSVHKLPPVFFYLMAGGFPSSINYSGTIFLLLKEDFHNSKFIFVSMVII